MAAKRWALADRRKAVGYTQEQLAARLGVERSTVVRWEAGETEPLPWCRPTLAQALSISLDVLQDLLAAPRDLQRQPGDALLVSLLGGDVASAQLGTLVERFAAMDIGSRREVLQELTTMSGAVLLQPVHRWLGQVLAVVPLVSPESVSDGALDALEHSVMLFRRWDSSGMGGLRRKAVVGQLNAVAESLHEPQSPEVSRRLFHITAELAQLAGWMAYDQDLPGVAQRYYLLGLSACKEARSPVYGAKILGDMAQLSRAYGHDEDSLDLVRTALYIVPRHDSALVRTELFAVESRAHARLGSQAAATRAAEACVEAWQEAQGEHVPDWLYYIDQAEIDGALATTYTELALRTDGTAQAMAHAERAEQYTLSGRESRAQGLDRSRIFDEIRLAKVRLAQRDVAESVTIAQAAVALAAPTSSLLVCNSLLRFHGELTARYPGNAHVVAFSEELREYVQQIAPHKERDVAST